jgi:hypothetical protein
MERQFGTGGEGVGNCINSTEQFIGNRKSRLRMARFQNSKLLPLSPVFHEKIATTRFSAASRYAGVSDLNGSHAST